MKNSENAKVPLENEKELTEKVAELDTNNYRYDEDNNQIVKRKPLPKKLKIVLEHICFVLVIVAISVLLSFAYFETTQIDLEKYYIIGSYRVVSVEKLYPEIELSRTSNTVTIEALQNGLGKRYEQTIIYNFEKVTEKTVNDAFTDYVEELKKKANGFQTTDFPTVLTTNQEYLTHQTSKNTISLLLTKDSESKTLTIKISYK